MATADCSHPSMKEGKCPTCGITAGSGLCRYCGQPWDDHKPFAVGTPKCPTP